MMWPRIFRDSSRRGTLGLFAILLCGGVALLRGEAPKNFPSNPPAPQAPKSGPPAVPADLPKGLYSGKVVFLQEALKRKGVTAKDEMKGQVVLETASGELWPIVADWRGRAFFQDKRLRDRQVDLVCGRTPGSPYLQVLMVFTFDEEGERQFTDYWCDICSIPMYEIKDCECCQGPIRLRFRPQNLPDYILKQKSAASSQK